MPNRLKDVPAMARARTSIAPERYKRVRLALRRLENPLRFALPGMRGLDVVLEDRLWLCVDRTLDDLPIVAWLDFEAGAQRALHEAVPCRVQFYHFHAQAIMDAILEHVDRLLEERLAARLPSPGPAAVTPLRRRRRSR